MSNENKTTIELNAHEYDIIVSGLIMAVEKFEELSRDNSASVMYWNDRATQTKDMLDTLKEAYKKSRG